MDNEYIHSLELCSEVGAVTRILPFKGKHADVQRSCHLVERCRAVSRSQMPCLLLTSTSHCHLGEMPREPAQENQANSSMVDSPLPSTAVSGDSAFGFKNSCWFLWHIWHRERLRKAATGWALDTLSGFKAKLLCTLAVGPWATLRTFLSLNFLLCEMRDCNNTYPLYFVSTKRHDTGSSLAPEEDE